MNAVILEKKGSIRIGNLDISEPLGAMDVRIKPRAVGICGSDVHYYKEGRIGDFVVKHPMVLGHEASGVVVEAGSGVKNLNVGDRVCMEPGIPNFESSETLMGMYNLDPDVRFWATPPVHGCLRDTVVHPACLTFKLPDVLSFHEGALVEPVAIGVYSVDKASQPSGSTALVIGSGTIGLVTALAAESAGYSRVLLADLKKEKLDFVSRNYGGKITTINLKETTISSAMSRIGLNAVDVVFEASGSVDAYSDIAQYIKPGGRIVLIGMPSRPVLLDVVAMQVKEISTVGIFRYVNTFPKVLNLIASGRLNVSSLVTKTYDFEDSVAAFEYAAAQPGNEIKIMIDMK